MKLVRLISIALVALELIVGPAGAAPAPRVSARLHCAPDHIVHVVTNYALPRRAHAVWLNVTVTNDGLRLYLGKRVRVRPGERYHTDDILARAQSRGAVVRWRVDGRSIRWALPSIDC